MQPTPSVMRPLRLLGVLLLSFVATPVAREPFDSNTEARVGRLEANVESLSERTDALERRVAEQGRLLAQAQGEEGQATAARRARWTALESVAGALADIQQALQSGDYDLDRRVTAA